MIGQYAASIQTISSVATLAYYPAALDINGNLRANLINSSVTVNQGTSPWTVNASVIGTLPVFATVITFAITAITATISNTVNVIASYTAPWSVVASQGAGVWSVNATVGNNVNTLTLPTTSGGLSIYQGNLNATTATVKAGAGQIYAYHLFNNNATQVYVNLYNATAATVGLTTPTMQLGLPASGGATFDTDIGLPFSLNIYASACVSIGGVGAPGISVSSNVYYK